MEKALIAYLWDDAPAALRAGVAGQHPPPQGVVGGPAGITALIASLLPPALASLVEGYAPPYWGHVERFHQQDGSVLIVCSRAP